MIGPDHGYGCSNAIAYLAMLTDRFGIYLDANDNGDADLEGEEMQMATSALIECVHDIVAEHNNTNRAKPPVGSAACPVCGEIYAGPEWDGAAVCCPTLREGAEDEDDMCECGEIRDDHNGDVCPDGHDCHTFTLTTEEG